MALINKSAATRGPSHLFNFNNLELWRVFNMQYNQRLPFPTHPQWQWPAVTQPPATAPIGVFFVLRCCFPSSPLFCLETRSRSRSIPLHSPSRSDSLCLSPNFQIAHTLGVCVCARVAFYLRPTSISRFLF